MALIGRNLSSLVEIENYLHSPDFIKDGPMEQWAVLSAIQREIDLRYVVTESRHVSSFIDVAAYKGQLRTEALREIQREIYEVAPYFIDMTHDYQREYFNSFPTYFSPSAMNELTAHSIEKIFPDGTTPIRHNSAEQREGTIEFYQNFLLNVCYWLDKFRYVNACPYTFTLSTYTRDWLWKNETDGLCSDYEPLSDCYDVWKYNLGKHKPSVKKKEWDYDVDLEGSTDNGQAYEGIQVEVFQWFRTQNVNPVDFTDPKHPIGMEDFNGFPADDSGQIADLMPHRDDSWYPLALSDVEALTAEWKQYEGELSDYSVFPRHIPYDLDEWRCYGRMSAITDWNSLEYGFSETTSALMEADMSAGWDSVMTPQQVADWGTIYLSAFPNRGLTGKIQKVPVLSGTPAKGGFFDERGHLMFYQVDLQRSSSLHERWVDKYENQSETLYSSEEQISMHKEKVPLSVTIENPFALSADACYVMYSYRLPSIYDYTRDIIDYTYSYPSYPTDGLRMDEIIHQTQKSEQVTYHNTKTPSPPPHYKVTYYYQIRNRDEDLDDGGNEQHGTYKTVRYLLDGSKSLVIEDEELSSGIHWDSGWHKIDEYYGYADSFGLLTGEPMSSLSGDEISAPDWYPTGEGDQTAHVFYRAFPMSAYTYETLFAHLSNDFPPIDYDLLDYFDKNPPDGPWYEPGGWGGIGNMVELTLDSQMRLYTFFDFSESFGLPKEDIE